MRLTEITVENSPPVRLFSVSDLTDLVVIAGPNGVGKTRLLERITAHLRGAETSADIRGRVAATSPEEEAAWAKAELDMSSTSDMAAFRAALQANRRRHYWRSSLLVFESNRTIQNLAPLQFTWDTADPYED